MNISQEEEMQDLIGLHESMTDEEQDRTFRFLNEEPEKIKRRNLIMNNTESTYMADEINLICQSLKESSDPLVMRGLSRLLDMAREYAWVVANKQEIGKPKLTLIDGVQIKCKTERMKDDRGVEWPSDKKNYLLRLIKQ